VKPVTKARGRQRGYILISILFAVTIAIIALAAAVPAIKTRIKREREEELIHRAKQYTRAIQLYYRKFGRFPASIEQLENTNNVRFLRQKYKDPITGKDEWKLLRFGQTAVKPRPAYLKGATPAGSMGSSVGGTGATPAGSMGSSVGGTGATTGTGTGTSAGGTGVGGTGVGGTGVGGTGLGGTGTGSSSTGAGFTNASDISKPLSSGQTLGGAPIVGVASLSEKEGLKEIDGKTKYNEWEFVYDPTLDRGGRAGTPPAVGQPAGSPTGSQPSPGGLNMGTGGVSTGGVGTGSGTSTVPPR
jgi:type II secretory pathway pseudopilin PulG